MTRIGDAYRWVHGKVSDHPTNFSWVIPDKLAGSGLPVTHAEFRWLLQQGIRTVVTVRELPLPKYWLEDGIGYLHVKTEDFGAPTLEELEATVDYIADSVQSGKPVLVHCAAGKGRTGVILAAYFVKIEGYSATEAIERLRSMRPGSVQSEVQEMAISMYEKQLRSQDPESFRD